MPSIYDYISASEVIEVAAKFGDDVAFCVLRRLALSRGCPEELLSDVGKESVSHKHLYETKFIFL